MKTSFPFYNMKSSALSLCIIMVCLFGIYPGNMAAPSNQDNETKLAKGIEYYQSAQFDKAIAELQAVIDSGTADTGVLTRAYWYQASCYIGKNQTAEARGAVAKLLDLGVSCVEPDPEKEHPLLLRLYYEETKARVGNSTVQCVDPGVQTMAIVDFQNRSYLVERDLFNPMEKGFADMMINSLSGATKLKVVERDRLQWILKEHEIQDKYSMESAVRVGKLLGAQVVLFGSFIVYDKNELWLSARLVKVETGEILLTEQIEEKFKKLSYKLTNELGKKIAEKIEGEQVYQANESMPASMDAMLSYSQGLDYEDRDMFAEAMEKYSEALSYDKEYARAQMAIDRINPVLLANR